MPVPLPQRRTRRSGNALMLTIIALVIVGALALLGWWFFVRAGGEQGPQIITAAVSARLRRTEGSFVVEIIGVTSR